MGKMLINVGEELVVIPEEADVKLGGLLISDTACLSTFTVSAKTTTSAWLSWYSATGNYALNNAGTNGQTITSIVSFTLTIDGYSSPKQVYNTVVETVTFYLHDSEGGTLLDAKSFTRMVSGQFC
tara:strand:- start:30639 stop:31013 length:375 start_codon:yes stop_codon:yes gene_type:complete